MPRAIPKYRTAQFQLYAIARLAWRNMLTHITLFTTFSPAYTAALAAARQLAIDNAEALPDFQTRNAPQEIALGNLRISAKEARALWQKLKRYIIKTYPLEYEQKAMPKQQAHCTTNKPATKTGPPPSKCSYPPIHSSPTTSPNSPQTITCHPPSRPK